MQDLQAKINLVLIYLSGVWHKKRYIMISMWTVCILGWIGVSFMPNQYESRAKIYADTKNILNPLLNGLAVTGNIDEELAVISKTLLSRPNLESIAQTTDLYLKYKSPESYENLIKSLVNSIQLSGAKSKVYSISYTHSDPEMARKVVQATMQKFTDSIAGQTRDETNSASEFLSGQINSVKQRLEDSERELAEFKKENQTLLPMRGTSYYSNLNSLSTQVEDLQMLLTEKETEIQGIKSRFLGASKSEPGQSASIVVRTQYDDRIAALSGALDQLRIQYTDKHPNIIALKSRLKNLIELRSGEQENILQQASTGAISGPGDASNGALQEFSLRIATLESERDVIITRIKNANTKLKSLSEKLDLIPAIEADLVALTRDYEVTNQNYNDLLQRKESAELSRNVDKNTQSVKFQVLEPPMAALTPVGPPRVILYAMVFILSVAVGLVSAFVASQLAPIIANPNHLQNVIGNFTIIGKIEHLNGKRKRKLSRAKSVVFILTSGILFAILVALIVHEAVYGQSPIIWLK